MNIRTHRLELINGSPEIVSADGDNREQFSRLIGANVPGSWPPEILRDAMGYFHGLLRVHPESCRWLLWYAVITYAQERTLCGSIGFKSAPDENGTVEIGYSVLPEFQGQGFASEMVGGILRWAFSQREVRSIEAETDRTNTASIRGLHKNNFVETGPGTTPDSVRFRHYHIPPLP